VQVLVSVVTELGIAYCLWGAIFAHRGVSELGGFTLGRLMLYYLLANTTNKVLMGPDHGFMATEIYDGSLTRYLVFPVSFYVYKIAAYFARSSVALLQMTVMLGAYLAIFGARADATVTPASFLMGVVALAFSTTLYFSIASILELVAFWADNVWSLMVMLRFSTALFGGAMLPLSLFPDWSQPWLAALPFRYLVWFPVQTMLGSLTPTAWLTGITVTMAWTAVFVTVGGAVWSRGTRQYSGVGV
jgi:ABC-2 type transport system permease protein